MAGLKVSNGRMVEELIHIQNIPILEDLIHDTGKEIQIVLNTFNRADPKILKSHSKEVKQKELSVLCEEVKQQVDNFLDVKGIDFPEYKYKLPEWDLQTLKQGTYLAIQYGTFFQQCR